MASITSLSNSSYNTSSIYGNRVLGVDLDPQGNLGFNLGLDIGTGSTVYDVLKAEVVVFPTPPFWLVTAMI
mgnify:CR=1 FL=1